METSQPTTQGYIKVHRALQKHWIWTGEDPFSRGQAWVDLLLRASHTAATFPLGNQTVSIERGQFITSPQKLAEDWHWSRSAVRRFLEKLQHHQMISLESGKSYTTITITQYDQWQGQPPGQPSGQPTDPAPGHNQEVQENQENQENQKKQETQKPKTQRREEHVQPVQPPAPPPVPHRRKTDPYAGIGITLQDIRL